MGRQSSCTVFLLSPAYCGGRRAAMLMRPGSTLVLAQRLEAGTLTLGEAFSFMSGLYFRGKMAYATAFGRPASTAPAAYVITPTRGLQPPATLVNKTVVQEFAALDVAEHEPRYAGPLLAGARRLAETLPEHARVVLLGSIATTKYLDVLSGVLGGQLYFPADFIGRGDMSRGALMLRSAASGAELDYVALDAAATRRGRRPPRLT